MHVGPLLPVELPGLLDDTLGGVLPLEEKIQAVVGVGGPRDHGHFLTGEAVPASHVNIDRLRLLPGRVIRPGGRLRQMSGDDDQLRLGRFQTTLPGEDHTQGNPQNQRQAGGNPCFHAVSSRLSATTHGGRPDPESDRAGRMRRQSGYRPNSRVIASES
ncbi:MAG: hypothetical protein MZV63_58530 [Marinilabiliales bacterium]|nr:hypothetical protein [Marinilabiliales bacterium]